MFDTITSFCFPYMNLRPKLIPKKNPRANDLYIKYFSEIESFVGPKKLAEWKAEDEAGLREETEKLISPLESMAQVLKPSGLIIISTSPSEALSQAFDRLGFTYKEHEVTTQKALEDVVYVARKQPQDYKPL